MTDKNSSETAISSQDTIIAGQKENANLLQELVPEIKSIANSLQKIAKQQEKDTTSEIKNVGTFTRNISEQFKKLSLSTNASSNLQNTTLQNMNDAITRIMNALVMKVPSNSDGNDDEIGQTVLETVINIYNQFHELNEILCPEIHSMLQEVLETNNELKSFVVKILKEYKLVSEDTLQKQYLDKSLRRLMNVKDGKSLRKLMEEVFEAVPLCKENELLKTIFMNIFNTVDIAESNTSLHESVEMASKAIAHTKCLINNNLAARKAENEKKWSSKIKKLNLERSKFVMPLLHVAFGITLSSIFRGHITTNEENCTNLYSILTCFSNAVQFLKIDGLVKDHDKIKIELKLLEDKSGDNNTTNEDDPHSV